MTKDYRLCTGCWNYVSPLGGCQGGWCPWDDVKVDKPVEQPKRKYRKRAEPKLPEEKIRGLRAKYLKHNEIAEILGIPQSKIDAYMRKHGFRSWTADEIRNHPVPREKRRKLIMLYRSKADVNQMACELMVGQYEIISWLYRLGMITALQARIMVDSIKEVMVKV